MRVLFGAPTSRGLQVDAAHAVHAALELRDLVEKRRRELATYARLRLRLGLHTGRVVAGMMGSRRRSDYSVVGGVVPMAGRLAAASLPGRVLISSGTYELVAMGYECVPALDRAVPGESRRCFWVVRPLRTRG